ncbi:MAG: hypothetical protein ACRET2_09000 [Steroidobacteraceae bacterium]
MSARTELQREADAADCDLYRLICRLETMYRRHEDKQTELAKALNGLSRARTPLRMLMHEADRETTL